MPLIAPFLTLLFGAAYWCCSIYDIMNAKFSSGSTFSIIASASILLCGCATTRTAKDYTATPPSPPPAVAPATAPVTATDLAHRRNEEFRRERYPVDGRNFTPVDKNIAKLGVVKDNDESSLNAYVLAIAGCYPTDGSYAYRCQPMEYDLYNGVTQDLWYKGRVVAKAHPNWTRCSYCCGMTFEVFYRAMQYRNIQKGLDPDDFNGMSFSDLFNLLQLWYIEGSGDSPPHASRPAPSWRPRLRLASSQYGRKTTA